jgi:hypothetical protein
MIRRFATAATLSLSLAAGAALADGPIGTRGEANSITDASVKTRPSDFSLLGYIPLRGYGFGIGVEGRYEIPIVANGFIPSINDSISLEPSFGISYNGSVGDSYHLTTLSPALYGLWSFWFSEQFRAYGGLGLGYNIAFYSGPDNGASYGNFYWDPVIGIFYRFAPAIAFRAEAGHEAIKAGVSFFF